MSRRRAARLALGAAALLVAATASAAPPIPVAVVRPAHPDPVVVESVMRLRAELLAAGFAVILVDADPARDARDEDAGAVPPAATITVIATGHGAVADVWIAGRASRDTVVRRVDAGTTSESSRPAALAIRAVELLRGGLLAEQAPTTSPAAEPPPASALPVEEDEPSAPTSPPRPRPRGLLQGPTVEAGLTALRGLGEDAWRLAPALRFAYGPRGGLAGRLTLMGPTSTDQVALVEVAYAFAPPWPILVPVLSLGAGGIHAHLDDTANARFPRLRTDAWGGVLSAGAGVAARATDRAAFLLDAHALFVELGPGAFVGAMPASGKQLVTTASLGVVAGF